MSALRRRFVKAVESNFVEPFKAQVYDALAVAEESLKGMARYDGSPYIGHSMATALIVMEEIGLGSNSTVSTLLHDLPRLGMMTFEEVEKRWNPECKAITMGLCNISDVDAKVSNDQATNFRELIVSYAANPRVILIKLADRLEVMRSLAMFPAEKQQKKSWESMHLYAHIAHKLGLYPIKSELEDISLSYMNPAAYRDIAARLEASAAERDEFIRRFKEPVEARLDRTGIRYQIKSRTKSIFSIWSKMQRMKIPFEEVYDIFALRIIVDCSQEEEKSSCWGIYSMVTDFYTPNPDRMRDWISIPKSNGYESLHTTVVTPEGKWVEVQIRTERMDEIAERGIAAHWRYKGVGQGGVNADRWLAQLRELMESDLEGDALAHRNTHSSNEIFIFTPKGDLRRLPEGATLLDFAFDIHTNLGATCTGGRVNQRNVPIKERLKNGDIVEIFTSKNQRPKIDWLSIVTTSKARNKIRAYMREEQARAADLGREELERKIKNWRLNIAIDDAVTFLCKQLKLRTGLELYGRIADGKVNLLEYKELIGNYIEFGDRPQPPKPRAEREAKELQSPDALVIEEHIGGIQYNLAKCCNPIKGDKVFGFVTVNSGITIHRSDCPNARRLREHYPYRVIEASWREEVVHGSFQASIRIVAEDVPGMVNLITDAIVRDLKLNMRSMSISPAKERRIAGIINVEVPSVQVIELVAHTLLRIRGVIKAFRVTN